MSKKNKIQFRMVAFTDAAGKYSAEAVRNGNEDNFYVDDDLTDDSASRVGQDNIVDLGEYGMLMCIADGMGGMNAGEVASQIAVDTVKAAFSVENLRSGATKSVGSRTKFMELTIKQADKNIKAEARQNPASAGMGSTLIIAWLYGCELTISWIGDSRAYLFNEKSGIRLISEDHSYVQDLVKKGLLTYDQTFDHPQNNIITRSLGDPSGEVKPESRTVSVGRGDIILLCSDGLSGVLRDRKTYDSSGNPYPEENLEDIIRANTGSMKQCREALWAAAERGGWYDNVTAILCQITSGPESVWNNKPVVIPSGKTAKKARRIWLCGLIFCGFLLALVGAFFAGKYFGTPAGDEPIDEMLTDSIPSDEQMDSIPAMEEPKSTPEPIKMPEVKESKPKVADDAKPQTEDKVTEDIEERTDTAKKTLTKKMIKNLTPKSSKEDHENENPLTK